MTDGITHLAPVKSPNGSGFDVVGSFGIGATGAVSATDQLGDGWSVVRVSAGLYRVTVRRFLYNFIGLFAGLEEDSDSVGEGIHIRDRVVADRTFDIQVESGAAAADPPSGSRIHFRAFCLENEY